MNQIITVNLFIIFSLKKSTLIGSFVGLCMAGALIIAFIFFITNKNDDGADHSWGDKLVSSSHLGKFKKV